MDASTELKLALFALSFVPGAGPYVAVITQWGPAIVAGLPIAEDLISKGAQKLAAFKSAHPQLLDAFKALAAAAQFGDASRADEISDDDAVAFASPLLGQPWTAADVKRWNDKATGAG